MENKPPKELVSVICQVYQNCNNISELPVELRNHYSKSAQKDFISITPLGQSKEKSATIDKVQVPTYANNTQRLNMLNGFQPVTQVEGTDRELNLKNGDETEMIGFAKRTNSTDDNLYRSLSQKMDNQTKSISKGLEFQPRQKQRNTICTKSPSIKKEIAFKLEDVLPLDREAETLDDEEQMSRYNHSQHIEEPDQIQKIINQEWQRQNVQVKNFESDKLSKKMSMIEKLCSCLLVKSNGFKVAKDQQYASIINIKESNGNSLNAVLLTNMEHLSTSYHKIEVELIQESSIETPTNLIKNEDQVIYSQNEIIRLQLIQNGIGIMTISVPEIPHINPSMIQDHGSTIFRINHKVKFTINNESIIFEMTLPHQRVQQMPEIDIYQIVKEGFPGVIKIPCPPKPEELTIPEQFKPITLPSSHFQF